MLLGQGYPNGEAPAIGRVAALDAGLPISVTGYQLDRRCGSGLQTILNAAMQVQTGASDVVLAGGARVHEPDRVLHDGHAMGSRIGERRRCSTGWPGAG